MFENLFFDFWFPVNIPRNQSPFPIITIVTQLPIPLPDIPYLIKSRSVHPFISLFKLLVNCQESTARPIHSLFPNLSDQALLWFHLLIWVAKGCASRFNTSLGIARDWRLLYQLDSPNVCLWTLWQFMPYHNSLACLRHEYLLFPMTYDLCPMPLLFFYPMPHSFLTISCLERRAPLLSQFVLPVSAFPIQHLVSNIGYFLTLSHTISYLGDSVAFPWVVGIWCIKIGHVLWYQTEKKCPPQLASTLKLSDLRFSSPDLKYVCLQQYRRLFTLSIGFRKPLVFDCKWSDIS